MPDRNSGLRYQNVEENLDNLYRNTAIPDETFGPDEERIFIDVDPYDLDDSMFGLQHSDPVKITPVLNRNLPVTPSKSDMDYVEESLKNVEREWHDTSEVKNHRSSTHKNHNKDAAHSATTTDNIGLEVFYIPESTTKHSTEKSEESRDKMSDERNRDNSESEHISPTVPLKGLDMASEKPDTDNEKPDGINQTDEYGDVFEEEMKKKRVYVENDTVDNGSARSETPKDLEEDLIDLTLTENRESVETDKDVENLPRHGEAGHNSSEDTKNSKEDTTSEETQKANKSLEIATTVFSGPNVTIDSTLASLNILGKNKSKLNFREINKAMQYKKQLYDLFKKKKLQTPQRI